MGRVRIGRGWAAIAVIVHVTTAAAQGPPETVWIEAGPERVESLALSPDAALLATGSYNRSIKLWDTRTGRYILSRSSHQSSVYDLRFSADGRRLFSAGGDGTEFPGDNAIRIWRTSDWSIERVITGVYGAITCMDLSGDEKLLGVATIDLLGNSSASAFINVSDGTILGQQVRAFGDYRNSIALTPDGASAVIGEIPVAKYQLSLVTVPGAAFRRAYLAGRGDLSPFVLSPDGTIIADRGYANDWRSVVRIWNIATNNVVAELPGYPADLRFSPTGDRLAVAVTVSDPKPESVVRTYRRADWSVLHEHHFRDAAASRLAWSKDGSSLAIGLSNRVVLIRDSDGAGVRDMRGRLSYWVEAISYSADGRRLVHVDHSGHEIVLWDARAGVVTARIAHVSIAPPPWRTLCMSPDGVLVVGIDRPSLVGSAVVRVWSADDGTHLRDLDAAFPQSVEYSPDGTLIAVSVGRDVWGVLDTEIRDAASGALVRTIPDARGPRFTSDSTRIVVFSSDDTLGVWRLSDGELLYRVPGVTGTQIALSPDGEYFAVAETARLRVWRTEDASLARTIEYDRCYPISLEFAAGGTIAECAWVGWNSSIRFWRISDGELLRTIDEEVDPSPMSFAVSPHRRYFALGRFDATLLVARGPFSCDADFNDDGAADSRDFYDFLDAFLSARADADINTDHAIDSRDFFDFISLFFAGC